MGYFRAAAMTLGLFSSLCVCCNADAAVKIAVSGQTVEVEVSPRSATRYSQYHLEYLIRKDGTVLTGPYIRQLGKVGAGVARNGEAFVAHYKINNGIIVIASAFPGFAVVSEIRTNGKDSCTCSREYTKLPHHQFFESTRRSNKEHMFLSDLHSENETCSITEVAD
jgi:hypothetical protein